MAKKKFPVFRAKVIFATTLLLLAAFFLSSALNAETLLLNIAAWLGFTLTALIDIGILLVLILTKGKKRNFF